MVKYLNYLNGFGYGHATIAREVDACLKFWRNPTIIIDAGGNKGLWTKEMLSRNAQSKIVIFEPNKDNVSHLKECYGSNSRVSIVAKAVGSKVSKAILYSDYSGSGIASLSNRRLSHFNVEFNHKEEVELTTLDHEVPGGNVDILKMDIEGHELEALKGAQKLLENVKVIQFEFGGANIDSRTYFQDFFYFLNQRHFTIWRLTPFGLVKVEKYNERMEKFITTNYIVTNNKFI